MKRNMRKTVLLVLLAIVLCTTVSAIVIGGTSVFSGRKNAPQALYIDASEICSPRQAYELCYADNMDLAILEGVESGWEIDNRAGMPKTTTDNNGLITDVMTDEHSRLLRYFNRVTEGKLDLLFCVTYQYNFNGNVLRLCDEDDSDTYYLVTKDNAFWLQTADGLTRISEEFTQLSGCNILFRIIIDLDEGVGTTYINNQLCGTCPLTGSALRYLSFETLDETCNTTQVRGGYIQANYAVYENFSYPTAAVNCEFTNAEQLSLSSDHLSVPGGVATTRTFDALGGNVSFNFSALLPDGAAGEFALCAGETDIVKLEARAGKLYANGRELKGFTGNMWYGLRVEADVEAQRAVIKVSNKIVDTVDFLANTNYVNQIRFANTGATAITLDDIMVYNLLDYDIPEPVIPEGADDYTIGINVCSLWENGASWSWSAITPYDDLTPVLGYYDETLPETADWEIKFMAEHGIDFQAFCWYAPVSNGPIKSNARHLDNGFLNAKYSDMMKFCLLWEAANGQIPENSAAFRNYYVPYWMENYFSNSSYMVIDNKPVLAIFGSETLIERFGTELKTEFDYMREEVKKLGFDGMIILDCNSGTNDITQYGFDGWYAYNWGTAGYSLEANKRANLNAQSNKDAYVVPTISVGFNNVGWAQTRHPLMTVDDFRAANQWVKDTYLPQYAQENSWQDGFVMLSTWNEYGEGTYLMPSEGLNGFGYLDTVREVYTDGGNHEDTIPTEEQKARITHNYPQDRRLLRENGSYTVPESTNKVTYNFTSDGQKFRDYLSGGWQVQDGAVTGSGASFTSTGTDPAFIFASQAYEQWNAEDVLRVRVVASGIPADESMQLFFSTSENGGISETNSIKVASTTTNETEFVFELANHAGWAGEIREMRLDPLGQSNVTFTIKSITFELPMDYAEVYVNGNPIHNKIKIETKDGVDYLPFEPGVSLIQYYLYTYYEWDYDTATLTLHHDKHSYQFTAGNDYALVDGSEKAALGGTIYQQDNIPMLPIKGLAQVLGLHCVRSGRDYYITTPEKQLYESTEGIWVFDRPGDTCGWGATNVNIAFVDDGLRMTATQKADGTYDPILWLENLDLDCSQYKTLEIKCKWSMTGKTSDRLGFYFATDTQPGLSESKHVTSTIQANSNGYQIIRIAMSQNENWSGTLSQLRFDPFDAAGTIDIAYIRFVEAETEHVLLEDDAEGETAFTMNQDISVSADLYARLNKCYHVASTDANRWLYAISKVQFTPGTTCQIDFDVMLDPAGENESSQLICNLRYAEDGALNGKDHIVKQLDISKSDGWVHYHATWTVPENCTDRSLDAFCIYSNPQNGITTSYYFDNVKVVTVDGQETAGAYNLNMFMLGNSLLSHGANRDLGWYGNWGMAASAEDKDYAHRLHAKLSGKYGEVPYATAQISSFENAIVAQDNADYAAALASYETTFKACCATNVPEIVTIQMGENVSVTGLTTAQYKNAVMQLITMIRSNAPDCVIVLCTPFWGGDVKIEAVNQIASEVENVRIARLDTLNTDENKAIGQFSHSGVAAHPGDTGMENIAQLIYNELDTLITANFQPSDVILPSSMAIIAPAQQITMERGTLQLLINTIPANADKTVQWSSSDDHIATVDANGIVTAINDGVITVTAKSLTKENLTATYTVTVSGQAPAYTITYDANLPAESTDTVSDMPEPDSYAKGPTGLSAKIPARRYYIFAGWALSQDATDTVTELNVTGDVTVYAVWRIADWWDFEMADNQQGIAVENGFHVHVQDGMLTTIATGTDTTTGNVLCIVSPELNLQSAEYAQFVVTMKNNTFQSSTKLTLTITTDQGEYTFEQPVTTDDYTTYTFDLSNIEGMITGFRLTPTDIDCSIEVQEMGFQR